ncbi:bifunctional proline dehydrogenase/L-glutamate gamma-semialdehyde dehydrogenase PutA [Phaeobacter sp. PT47_59]|uniref:bifunctional proline dehydrogenase/L-glutamate gamma-semialdehyde dehydrogenase PutA n=1 Tax=Phaeobacter sp. PT47_59 TaxID=3029979 RepID=UPI002380A5DC|nr:bifunctional proline dehydrogenase/L-glutamate gamma-semialdehyde dehydrogenase PutA [Phaeobacter sp. PT47_59]MDE4173654.1 bifunctional proline dehydrogenase/L-glutamate gamma-semialdehyde dehydrogenase PutA [Phaeobacter sp. PT47_59]
MPQTPDTPFQKLRDRIDAGTYVDQTAMRDQLVATAALTTSARQAICANAAALVKDIRGHSAPGLMEVFLAEYGLSTDEGIALMCLAEALLRVPDADTIDALIEDKIAPSDWGKHLGHSSSPLVNASTWALMLTGKVLDEDKPSPVRALRGAIKRLGEPVIRTAVGRAMKEMGRQFVLGESIESAMKRAAGMEAKGYTYSYDMLGEAARTEADASRYHLSYSKAISAIAAACTSDDIRKNPGISVKLSALHPRYELAQEARVMEQLVPRLKALALLAKAAGMGLNVDAEEADRLSLSLEVIEAVVSDPSLAGWDGFGVVVQAYGPRTGLAIDALYEMAERYNRRFMVRLVKGAYWDTEIKRAQVEGVDGFPVYTSKALTDVSYIANARKLLGMTDRIYPQFATHNAHTVSAILHMAEDKSLFEFQRLHGMGETLHQMVKEQNGNNCRIYAPVGAHRDLLAYLVRRLLENGANSSFVNQIVDENVPPEVVAADPFDAVADISRSIPTGPELFAPERANSKGFDLGHAPTLAAIEQARAPWRSHNWRAAPLLAGDTAPEPAEDVTNPSDLTTVGQLAPASDADVETALTAAHPWDASAETRAAALNKAADLYEEHYGELFALLAREAGKSIPDAVAELREAVDFLRYYAARIPDAAPAGLFTCISPWNFPLAIFTGQISAALASGNAVLAKPAEQTPLIAHRAVELLHAAGVPQSALQLLPGPGSRVGAALTSDPRVSGVAFTGSTETALRIRRAMADTLRPGAPLIAETGGLNAMIVDSTALPEQAVQSIIESAFQSAGQRCSALRCLYVQEDIAEDLLKMLKGAMDVLTLGDPWHLDVDSGPVIDAEARAGILAHIDQARAEGRVLKEMQTPQGGTFVAPTLIEVSGIGALEREIFGPVLHVARFKSQDLDQVIDDINATGYGLTFGLHTRIDDRVQHVCDRIHAGNIYVNRNQIGAIVGSQPFGGEGLSGTGPKAGGPNYMARFCAPDRQSSTETWQASMTELPPASGTAAPAATTSLPGPTGESNRLTTSARPPLLCLGPGAEAAAAQAQAVHALGGTAIEASGLFDLHRLQFIEGIAGVLWWGDEDTARRIEQTLAKRQGPIIPLIPGKPDPARVHGERHVCVDTTAAGGNAALLGGAA